LALPVLKIFSPHGGRGGERRRGGDAGKDKDFLLHRGRLPQESCQTLFMRSRFFVNVTDVVSVGRYSLSVLSIFVIFYFFIGRCPISTLTSTDNQ
jgi:hypothetical protein